LSDHLKWAAADPERLVIKVFLVEDHALFASGVRTELGEEFELIGHAGTVEDAIKGVLETEPEVVLVDVHSPTGAGRAWSSRARACGSSRSASRMRPRR
jgi:DNA-binding NarL/FixJ family response regulator